METTLTAIDAVVRRAGPLSLLVDQVVSRLAPRTKAAAVCLDTNCGLGSCGQFYCGCGTYGYTDFVAWFAPSSSECSLHNFDCYMCTGYCC